MESMEPIISLFCSDIDESDRPWYLTISIEMKHCLLLLIILLHSICQAALVAQLSCEDNHVNPLRYDDSQLLRLRNFIGILRRAPGQPPRNRPAAT